MSKNTVFSPSQNGGGVSGRISFIDAMRGFAIFLVVFGHVGTFTGEIGSYETLLRSAIISVWMPLFFFISGFVSFKSLDVWTGEETFTRIKQKAFALLVPMLIFVTFFTITRGSWSGLLGGALNGYWFTEVLFEMFVIYYLVAFFCNKVRSPKLFDALMVAAAALVLSVLIFFRGDSWLWNGLCLENFTKYLQFFVLGLLCKKYYPQVEKLLRKDWFAVVTIAGYIVSMAVICVLKDVDSARGVVALFRHIVVGYLGVALIFLLFFRSEKFFATNGRISRAMQFLGRRTLDIYFIHYFFLPKFNDATEIFTGGSNFVFELLVCGFVSLVVLAVSLAVSSVLRTSPTLAQWLFGGKRKKSE